MYSANWFGVDLDLVQASRLTVLATPNDKQKNKKKKHKLLTDCTLGRGGLGCKKIQIKLMCSIYMKSNDQCPFL